MKKTDDKKRLKEKNKGITLVALVVTIIVLMILAGITLSLVLGQNGIIGKAQQAKSSSQNAQNAEQEGLSNLDQEAEDTIKGIKSQVGEYRDSQKVISASTNTQVKDDSGNTVTIPAGFKIASDSATKQEDGIVIEDKDGNQFVWIPVLNVSNYTRTDFGSSFDNGGYSSYLETMPSDEQASVNTYHGYYIGRYEAGDKECTDNKKMKSSSVITDTVTIKKGQAIYSYVTADQANTLATGMKTIEGYSATTKLCSSYAWDTALNFIQKTVPNYATSSNQGNYNDTTFNYIDITGTSQTKALGSNALIPTGQTTPVCNIYDMGGNDWDWTTETFNSVNYPCVSRGGNAINGYASYPASYRFFSSNTYFGGNMTFRVTLYM